MKIHIRWKAALGVDRGSDIMEHGSFLISHPVVYGGGQLTKWGWGR